MNNYSAVLAGASIEKGEYVRLETTGSKTVAYPVNREYDRMLLPTAAESASRGDLVTVESP